VVLVQACGGVVAGGTSALATTPMDTVKTRLQVMSSEGGGRPTIKQTVKQLLRDDGWWGFYKGVGPRFLSMSLWGTSMITTYEFLSKFI
jgi:solute carrier family 25 protein 44